MAGVCKICGAELPRRKRSYCSDACKREGLKLCQRVTERKPHPPSALYTERACIDCGTILLMHIKSKRCPQCQTAANLKSDRESKRRQYAGVSRKLGSTDLCQRCGQPYVVKSGLQRYCPACASIAAQENDRAKSRDLARERLKDPEYRDARNAKRRDSRRTLPRVTNDSPIAAARIRAGMTQAQLAQAVGCMQKEISMWETGARCPRATTIIKIAKALNCTVESLIDAETL